VTLTAGQGFQLVEGLGDTLAMVQAFGAPAAWNGRTN
jgi:hypothetical protein